MKPTFQWGIIGPGRIARKFASALFEIPDTCIYAVASRSSSTPEQLKQTFHAEKCYVTYEELAADSHIDAIYVATPNRFHFENVKMCLEAGKAVLCEKPITVNASEAEDLFKFSQSKRVFLMEALWTRFLPIYEHVREWLEAGEIGDIRLVESTFGVVTPRIAQDRFLNAELAGGSLLDLGVYNVALSQWVFQKSPQSITATGQIGETGVDEAVSAILSFENDATALFTSSFRAPMLNQIVITGNKGIITIHPRFVEASRASLTKDGKTRTIEKPLETNGFEFEIKAAMRAIRDGALDCPQMTQTDTLENMRTMDTIRQQIGLRFPFE